MGLTQIIFFFLNNALNLLLNETELTSSPNAPFKFLTRPIYYNRKKKITTINYMNIKNKETGSEMLLPSNRIAV